MKNGLIVLCFLVALGLIFYYYEETKVGEVDDKTRSIEYVDDGEIIRVLDKEGEVFHEYFIGDFREWAGKNWDDFFEESPAFGEMREVQPENFYRFDEGASLSPQYSYLAFSVHDYAAATTLSFVGVIDLNTKEVDLIKKDNKGEVGEIKWSPGETDIAYALHTAKAKGDYLVVDNLEKMEEKFSLSAEDILKNKEADNYRHFMPRFRDIKWREDGQRIKFVTDDLQGEGALNWSINNQKEDLKRIGEGESVEDLEGGTVIEGTLLINNPGMLEDVWHLSYEDDTSSIMIVKLRLDDETDCLLDADYCKKLFASDEKISGKKVRVKGVEDNDYLLVRKITKEI